MTWPNTTYTGHYILLSLRHIYHSKQKSEDMHVLGAYPPCSFQSQHIITSVISACRVNTC